MTTQDEIELFFSKADGILFCEPESNEPGGEPLIFILYSDKKFIDFDNDDIHIKISNYFFNKRMTFLIILKDEIPKVSIADKDTGDAINLSNVCFHNSILDFIKLTPINANIVMLAANFSDKKMEFNQASKKNPHVTLDGYSVIYK